MSCTPMPLNTGDRGPAEVDDQPPGWQAPTEQEIRRRAYELYLERERESGGALDDWLEAEAELFLERGRRRS